MKALTVFHMKTKLATLCLLFAALPFFAHAQTAVGIEAPNATDLRITDGPAAQSLVGCFFEGSAISAPNNIPTNSGGTHTLWNGTTGSNNIYSLPIDAGGTFGAYMQAHPGTYTIGLIESGGSGTCTSIIAGYTYYVTYEWNNGLIAIGTNTNTRFVAFTPSTNELVATGTNQFAATLYLNADDYNEPNYISFTIQPLDEDAPNIIYSGAIETPGTQNMLPGPNTFSTTTDFNAIGLYKVTANYYSSTCSIFGFVPGFCYSLLTSTTTYFTVGTSSPYRAQMLALTDTLNNLFASTTYNIANSCNPISGFQLDDCLIGLLVPSASIWDEDIALLRGMPPWGYAFRLYDIMTNTATTSMVILSATVPQGLPGAGAHIELDPNHALDYILNASSSFTSAEASSTQTFYEITSYYWNIAVYLALGLYILRRVLGKSLIPHFKGSN